MIERFKKFSDKKICIFRSKGTVKLLQTYRSFEKLWHYDLIYSTAQSKIGICSRTVWGIANCAQYDYNGNLLLKTDFSIQPEATYNPVRLLAMLNLSNGGFLLMIDECPEDIHKCRQRILKIGPDGKVSGFAIIFSPYSYQELSHIQLRAKLFENEMAGFCVSMVYYPGNKAITFASDNTWRFGFASVCINERDFDKL